VNEPFSSTVLAGLIPGVTNTTLEPGRLGNDEIVRWYLRAAAIDPNITLCLNDYNVLEGLDPVHRGYTTSLVQWMQARGARIDTLGLQAHFGQVIIGIPELNRRIDRVASLGLKLAVTEFDADTFDEPLQADYTRDVLTLVFSRPEFDQFLMWGFWEGAHWLPNSAMYRLNWDEKLNDSAYKNLVFNTWRTNYTGLTTVASLRSLRAFQGEAKVTVTTPDG